MKKITILAILIGLSTLTFGQSNAKRVYKNFDESKLPPIDQWEPFQLGIGIHFPESTRKSNVYGLKLGMPFSGGEGRVFGVEFSILGSATDVIKGLQAAIFANVSKMVEGVQLGLVNIVKVNCNGLQLGLVNISEENSFQLGLVNVLPKGPVPFMPLINFHFPSDFRTYEQTEPSDDF